MHLCFSRSIAISRLSRLTVAHGDSARSIVRVPSVCDGANTDAVRCREVDVFDERLGFVASWHDLHFATLLTETQGRQYAPP